VRAAELVAEPNKMAVMPCRVMSMVVVQVASNSRHSSLLGRIAEGATPYTGPRINMTITPSIIKANLTFPSPAAFEGVLA
jgi:hypothetical protein